MRSFRRILAAALLLIMIMSMLTACAPNYEKWILGTWAYQHEYHYSGVVDCTITFEKDMKIKHTGISDDGGNYRFLKDNGLRIILGTGSFEINDYTYDSVKGREKGSGCWCMINRDRMFIDGVMYKRIKQ